MSCPNESLPALWLVLSYTAGVASIIVGALVLDWIATLVEDFK
jgi:hypothetical protein